MTTIDLDSAEDVPLPAPARELLTGLRIGTLSTLRRDDDVGVVPVGIVRRDDLLLISSQAQTEKVRSLRGDPRATLCIVDPGDATRYVEIRGVAEIVDDVDKAFINWIAREFMGADEYPHEPTTVARVVIIVHPRRVTMPQVHGGTRS